MANVAAGSHARQSKGSERSVGTEVHYVTWAMLGLARTPSMITLGCLDEGDKRGEGKGLLLKSTRLRARYGYCNKVEERR